MHDTDSVYALDCISLVRPVGVYASTPPLEANEKVQSGDWVLVDLRPASRHREAHPQGAVNAPLYKEVAGRMHVMN